MRHIHDWTAKRAGGRITVYGKEIVGTERKEVRITCIDKIQGGKGPASSPYSLAVDKDGEGYALMG